MFWNGRTEKHQTSTAVFLAGWKNWVTQPLPRSLCAVSTSTPKPHAEGRVRAGGTLLRRSRLPPRSVLGAPHRGAAPEAAAETKSFCPCHKTGGNSGFLPVFFLHVLHGNGVRFGSDSGFSHPFAPVPNRCHPLKHPKRTRLQLFSPEIGCVSLFLPSFDLQNFRAGFSQTSGLSSHSYRFILTRPFPNAMIRIPSFVSKFFLIDSGIIVTHGHNAPQVKVICRVETNFENLQRPAQPCGEIL